ncbi:MAG: hypothetical protein Q4E20_09120 [Eubacteriales bacterium]|nr:hypothetical protein [Eubacteriales bacterium]
MGRHTIRRRRSVSGRAFVTLLALVLVFGCAVGGTFAWLTAKTDAVVNTFTYGDINIGLAETTGNNYKIIPGVNIEKNPKVTVTAGSEACWLFVKVDKENWPEFKETDGKTAKIAYEIAPGWTELESGVYYREVGAAAADTSFEVIKDNVITVSENLTKTEVNNVVTVHPKLTFTAYAVQKDGVADAADAWAKVDA